MGYPTDAWNKQTRREREGKELNLTGIWDDLIVKTKDAINSKEIKVGVMLGFTGPIESLTPAMADAAELAFTEASLSVNK